MLSEATLSSMFQEMSLSRVTSQVERAHLSTPLQTIASGFYALYHIESHFCLMRAESLTHMSCSSRTYTLHKDYSCAAPTARPSR